MGMTVEATGVPAGPVTMTVELDMATPTPGPAGMETTVEIGVPDGPATTRVEEYAEGATPGAPAGDMYAVGVDNVVVTEELPETRIVYGVAETELD